MEKHFTIEEIATAWGVSLETVREIFIDEPGILRPSSGQKRKMIRVPQSVVERVYRRMAQ